MLLLLDNDKLLTHRIWWLDFQGITLPKTNSEFTPEKMDGIGKQAGFLLGFKAYFEGTFAVSFMEGIIQEISNRTHVSRTRKNLSIS